jgi:hypothetical protein
MKPQRLLLGVFIVVAGLLALWLTRPALTPRAEKTAPATALSTPPATVGAPAQSESTAPAPPPANAVPPALPGSGALMPSGVASARSPKPLNPPPPPGAAPAVPDDPAAPVAGPPSADRLRADIEEVQLALRDFRTGLGGNPVGSNAEITKALLGDNLKQIKIPVPAGSHLNQNSEMCDRLGTPYFFHQVSGARMEIRSAGADRQMWTADDVQK